MSDITPLVERHTKRHLREVVHHHNTTEKIDTSLVERLEQRINDLEAQLLAGGPNVASLQDNADAAARRVLKQVFERLDKIEADQRKAYVELCDALDEIQARPAGDAVMAPTDAVEFDKLSSQIRGLATRIDAIEGVYDASSDLSSALATFANVAADLMRVCDSHAEQFKVLHDARKAHAETIQRLAHAIQSMALDLDDPKQIA